MVAMLCRYQLTICYRRGKGRDQRWPIRFIPGPMRLLIGLLVCVSSLPSMGGIDESLIAISRLEREGKGNEAASAAWKDLVKAGPTALTAILRTAGKGSPVADNWLRLAGDVIVSNALRTNEALPLADVENFIKDTAQSGAARLIAFDLLHQADAGRADTLEGTLLHDPVQALRRGAVQRLIDAAKTKSGTDVKTTYLQALDAVRDEDQTKLIAGELKKLGMPIDLRRHFGFLTKWHVIGPFDNTERKGFDAEFEPEKLQKLEATYEGKGKQVKWQPFESADDYGKLDFNKPLGMQKEATAYAVTTFDADADRDAELRLGCKNAWKVWLNGELLFGRDEYHRGQQMDQYKMTCRLKKGTNIILVKCCQNEQKEEWTVEWEFQLRLCDSAGTAIVPANATAN